MSGQGVPEGLHQVQLLGLPVEARTRFSQHLADLTRELSLVRIGAARHPEAGLSPRLLQVAAELGGPYAAFRAEPDAAVRAAVAAGADHCDVTYTVPASAGAFLHRLGEVLDEADDLCRSRTELLTLPAAQEVVAYRRWFVAEAERQLAGEAPRPWRHLPPSDGAPAPARLLVELPVTPADRAPADDDAGVVREPLVLQSLAGNVSAARRYVREVLRDLNAAEFEEAAELGVSEVVTNAVLHARTAFTLAVRRSAPGRIRVEVSDSSDVPLQLRPSTETATTGRGLGLVAALSDDWGVDHLPAGSGPGKTVWFEPRALDDDPSDDPHDWALDLESLV